MLIRVSSERDEVKMFLGLEQRAGVAEAALHCPAACHQGGQRHGTMKAGTTQSPISARFCPDVSCPLALAIITSMPKLIKN